MKNNQRSAIFRLSSFVFRHALIFILLIFTLLASYNSIVLPIGEAADETDHYQYLRFVARTGHPPLTAEERVEAGFKGGLAPLYYWLTAWPIALVGEDTPPDIRRVDSRPERHIPSDGLGINRVLHTLDEQWPWQGQPLAWHLVRFLSIAMGWVTIIATYAIARLVAPKHKLIAILAAAFVAFLPRFIISSAVINDDNLVFALISMLLLVQVKIVTDDHLPSVKMMALFGGLFGLTLITKYFALILIPTVLLTLFIVWRKNKEGSKRGSEEARKRKGKKPQTQNSQPISQITHPNSQFYLFSSFLIALFTTAGLWFIFITIRFNRIDELGLIAGLAASLGEPQITEGLVGLLSGQSVRPPAATYSLLAWFSLLYRSFWFEFGWMQIFAPIWVYVLFTLFVLLAIFGLIQLATTASKKDNLPISNTQRALRLQSPIFWLLALHLGLFLFVVLARYVLSATIDTGQGRHLYPAISVIALLIAIGVYSIQGSGVRGQESEEQVTSNKVAESQKNTQPKTQNSEPETLNSYPTPVLGKAEVSQISHPKTRIAIVLLPAICYLLLSTFSLSPTISGYASRYISPHYNTLPITTTPANSPFNLKFAPGLSLVDMKTETSVAAGNALPVTLTWQAKKEAEQDYLVSLCLQNKSSQPVACRQSHFVDGQYPARAWESGDTIVDTIHIPIPVCYRLSDAQYSMQLTVWPLDNSSIQPALVDPPVLSHTFTEPLISIRPTDSLRDIPQTVELWQNNERLSENREMTLRQSLSQITYAAHNPQPLPQFVVKNQPDSEWLPAPQPNTSLHLPCDDGPQPFATLSTFIVDPSLPAATYQSYETTLPNITLSNRNRTFAPVTSTLTFSKTLAPITIHNSLFAIRNSLFPVSIQWQAQRTMADPLIVALKLLDKDFNVGGERIATIGDRYPNVLWAPTEVVEETYPLQIKPNTPPGLYQLEVSVIRQDDTLPNGYENLPLMDGDTPLGDNLYPGTVRLVDPAHNIPPDKSISAQIGNSIHLTGFTLEPVSNTQSPVSLALHWESTAKIPADFTVFTQLIGPDGQVWAQWDNPPQAGRYPTSAWADTDNIVDRYILTLREGAPAGSYRLLVGMYNPATEERLPATLNDQSQPDNAIELTTIELSQ